MKLTISLSVDVEEARLKRAKSQGYDTTKIWYHGSPKTFTSFDLKAEKANRGTNVEGIYLTPDEYDTEKFGSVVYTLYTRTKRPYVYGKKNRITQAMVDVYGELLTANYSYSKEWFDTAIGPYFKKEGTFKDVAGWIKREVLMAGGYDSYKDGEHLCVFDPTMVRSVDAEFVSADKNKNNLMA